MDDTSLLKWGGISALVAVILLAISIAGGGATGFASLFGAFACFLVVATVAGYDYLARHQYSLARAGLGFAGLSIITLVLEAAVWGGDRMLRRTGATLVEGELSALLAVFSSLHMMVLWFIAIWLALWGMGFLRMSGRARLVGTFMVLVAAFNLVDYLLARLGQTGPWVDLWRSGGQLMLLGAFATLGLVLIEASRDTQA